jgi:hypothetical protein
MKRLLRDRWDRFFFAEEVPYGLALVRICLPLALLIPLIPRWPHAREIFSTDGAAAPLWESFGFPGLLPIPSGPLAVALCTLLGWSLAALAVGWMSRTSAAIAALLTAYLGMLDMLGSLTKYTCIATHVLLLLAMSPCGAVWSVDAWLRRRPDPWPHAPAGRQRRYAVWPQRLIQWLFAIIYFAAAMTKLQTPFFVTGDQLYFWLLTNVNFANPLGEWLSLYPPLLVVMGLVTVVWEILFPFLCWRGVSKWCMLTIGAVFHLMTALTLGLIVFPLVCLACYWAFVTEAEMQRLMVWVRRLNRRWFRRPVRSRLSIPVIAPPPAWGGPQASAVAFAAAAAVLIGLGLELEHWLDPYQARRGGEPLTPPVIEAELARRMLSGTERIQVRDKVFGFDVGSRTLGGLLADSKSEFRHGQRAIIECTVVPPHEDLWLEVNLHDARKRLIERSGQVMTRERIRTHFFFDMSERYPAGEYELVLLIEGQEVTRRRIAIREHRPGSVPTGSAAADPRGVSSPDSDSFRRDSTSFRRDS